MGTGSVDATVSHPREFTRTQAIDKSMGKVSNGSPLRPEVLILHNVQDRGHVVYCYQLLFYLFSQMAREGPL